MNVFLPNRVLVAWKAGGRYWWGGCNGAVLLECLSVSVLYHAEALAESTWLQTFVPESFLLCVCDTLILPHGQPASSHFPLEAASLPASELFL